MARWKISQFLLTAITKTYPNIATIDPLCILVPFAMGRVVCHICRPAEPCRTASHSTGRSGNLWPLPRLPTPNHSTRNSAQRQAPKKGAFSMTRKRLVCLRTPVSHQRQLRRRSADEVGFVQSLIRSPPESLRSPQFPGRDTVDRHSLPWIDLTGIVTALRACGVLGGRVATRG